MRGTTVAYKTLVQHLEAGYNAGKKSPQHEAHGLKAEEITIGRSLSIFFFSNVTLLTRKIHLESSSISTTLDQFLEWSFHYRKAAS